MPRLNQYSIEQLRAKALKAREFAQRCEDEADRKETRQISDAILRSAKRMGVNPAKVLEKLNTVQANGQGS